MTRTLADMAPSEQDLRVGTWFELLGADYPVILVSPDDPYDGIATVMIPSKAKATYTPMTTLTPRYDLPRVWTPSGEQVTGEWEESASPPGLRRWCSRWERKPEDVKPDPQPGEAWLIEYEGQRYEAVYWYSPLYAHWVFAKDREGAFSIESHEATPVSRLTPL